jgi:hypothetical protein
MSERLFTSLMIVIALAASSIPVSMAVGKYQVCKYYFPELTTYVCLFTNLPPYIGGKK